MFALTFLTRRITGLTLDDFVQHYQGQHFRLGVRLPGLISYQQALLTPEDGGWGISDMLADWDAISVYTFESPAAAEAAFASEAGVRLNEDTGLFMEWKSVISLPAKVIQRWEAPHASLRGQEYPGGRAATPAARPPP